MKRIQRVAVLIISCLYLTINAQADHHGDYVIHDFKKQQLTPVYWSEGGAIGDFNNDGDMDVVVGPDIYLGPNFDRRTGFRHEYYPAVAPTRRSHRDFSYYSNDNFFSWPYDFDGDGWLDIMVAGLPNTPAYWYENPGKPFGGRSPDIPVHWEKHFVHSNVKNEAPDLIDIDGDGFPELLTAYDEHYGYAKANPVSPRLPWTFYPISTHDEIIHHYTHGMGLGDIDGDGRVDYLTGEGWYRQPVSLDPASDWEFHPHAFLDREINTVFCCLTGGGTMWAYDVNGDGLNDVLTSIDSHGWGLSWYEQIRQYGDSGEMITFKEHRILSRTEENTDNPYGVQFSQLHDIDLVDIDGDGLLDILTGKTWRAHDFGDPGSRQDPVIYWFKLTRQKNGDVEYIPYKIDDTAGIGRQLRSGDINGDGHPDFVVGNKLGAFVFIQEPRKVSRKEWKAAQPVRLKNFK